MSLESVVFLLLERLGHRELIVLRGTSRDLCAVASDDHAWAQCIRALLEYFELGKDELTSPDYPGRTHGERRDGISFFPCETERVELAGLVLPPPTQNGLKIRVTSDGILEDMFHPESEDAAPNQFGVCMSRSKIYKARPLPLRCELCDVECDSYSSFTEHCITFKHKVLLDPSKQFDPRFEDPRFQDPRHGDGYAALPIMAKLEAMHLSLIHI